MSNNEAGTQPTGLSPRAKRLILSCLTEQKSRLIETTIGELDEDALADLGNEIAYIGSVMRAVEALPTKQAPGVSKA